MMKKMNAVTVLMAVLWSAITVLGTLSPLAQSGDVSNQFGDFGMWSALALILALFLLPLVFMNRGSKGGKTALAIVVGLFVPGSAVIISISVTGLRTAFSVPLAFMIACGVLYILAGILWYLLLVRSGKRTRR